MAITNHVKGAVEKFKAKTGTELQDHVFNATYLNGLEGTSYMDLSSAQTISGTKNFNVANANVFATGTGTNNYFQCRKFRGEGNANTYYHALDFGYSGHNQWDFYEYGGVYNFYQNMSADGSGKDLILQIAPSVVESKKPLKASSTFTSASSTVLSYLPNAGILGTNGNGQVYDNSNAYQPAGDYALKSDLESYQPAGNYALKGDLSGYAKTSDLSGYAKTTDLSGYVKTSGDQNVGGNKTFSGANLFTNETKFTNGSYAPTWSDIANGLGKSSCFTRGAFRQLITGQIMAPNTTFTDKDRGYNYQTGAIKFQGWSANNGQPANLVDYVTITKNGLAIPPLTNKRFIGTSGNGQLEEHTITTADISDLSGKFVSATEDQIVNGVKTFNSPKNVAGKEVVTTKFQTSNGGALYIGKEGPNSGTMLRFDQTEGTPRLYFRASATPGAMVWSQPEKGATLYFDLTNSSGDTTRSTLSARSGEIARTSDIGNGTITIQKNGTKVDSFSVNQSSNKTVNLTLGISDVSELQTRLDSKMDVYTITSEPSSMGKDGFAQFGNNVTYQLTQYYQLSKAIGYINAVDKGGQVSNNNSYFTGIGNVGGGAYIGTAIFDRDYNSSNSALVSSRGLLIDAYGSAFLLSGSRDSEKIKQIATTDDTDSLKTSINGKQATLVSGTNIKTVNGNSLLGSGNLTIQPSIPSNSYLDLGSVNLGIKMSTSSNMYITNMCAGKINLTLGTSAGSEASGSISFTDYNKGSGTWYVAFSVVGKTWVTSLYVTADSLTNSGCKVWARRTINVSGTDVQNIIVSYIAIKYY